MVKQLLAIVAELEEMHQGRRFTLDGHLVGSLGETAAEAMFALRLLPAGAAGHDAVALDGRTVEIKATYGDSGVGIRTTSDLAAQVLIVIRLSKEAGVPHETVYNGALARVAGSVGVPGSNGQARVALSRLRQLDVEVPDGERVARR